MDIAVFWSVFVGIILAYFALEILRPLVAGIIAGFVIGYANARKKKDSE